MKSFVPISLLLSAVAALPATYENKKLSFVESSSSDFPIHKRACARDTSSAAASTAKVYMAGDSTMAKTGNGAGTNTAGWGNYLPYSLDLTVVNDAIGGRSARSFTREGRFQAIADAVVAGDFVIIEFGHNDGGSLTPTDNGRTDCPGAGSETCSTTYDGAAETVLTFPAYITNAGNLMVQKGATVIVSSQTPNNPWESGTFAYSGSRFVTYANASAAAIGSSATFVDHGGYVANVFEGLGATTVDSYFPNDHTHTSPEGADVVAKAFVRGLVCSGAPLASHVKNSTSSLGSCL